MTDSTSSTGQQRPIAAITALTPDPAPAAALRTTPITALLSAFGLGNFPAPNFLAPNGPAAPPEAPGVWALLAWVRRQSAYTLDNTAPSLNGLVVPTQPSGLVVPTNWQPPPRRHRS